MRRSQTTGQILGSHSTADERTPLITPARPSGAEALAHSYPDPALPTPSGRDSLQRAISTAGYPAKKDHEAIDANHLDVRFKRWTEAIAQRMKSKAKGKRKAEEDSPPRLVLSVFEKISPQDAGSTVSSFPFVDVCAGGLYGAVRAPEKSPSSGQTNPSGCIIGKKFISDNDLLRAVDLYSKTSLRKMAR